MSDRDEALTRAGVREIEVSIILTVPVTAPQQVEDRLIGALSTHAADLPWVREAGIRKATLPYDDLLFLWNEVALAGPILRGIDTGDVFERLTCTEANALADIFTAAGDEQTAEFIIAEHALTDDDCDDMHHDKDTCEHDHEEEPDV